MLIIVVAKNANSTAAAPGHSSWVSGHGGRAEGGVGTFIYIDAPGL